jgi:hypothetical protein
VSSTRIDFWGGIGKRAGQDRIQNRAVIFNGSYWHF